MRGRASLGTRLTFLVAAVVLGCGGGRLTPGTVTVTYPNGGETWLVGTTETVLWSSEGFVSDVSVELSTDGGTSWSALVASTANDGAEDVTVPDAPSAQCLVRVRETDGEPSDVSDALFAIGPAITVTSPNGAEVWVEGGTRAITWSSEGTVGSVDIHYSTDAGVSWTEVSLGEANDGSYPWTVPHEDSALCLVRVQEPDGDPTDASDATFTIQYAPLIRVVSPNGNECWAFGETREIKWVNEGTVGNVDTYYSTDGGTGWTPIASGLANTGSYFWDVPNVDSTNCLVRVEEPDQDPTDDSDAAFTIAVPPFSDMGELFPALTYCSLAWGDYDSDGDLDLVLAGADEGGNAVTTVYRNDGEVLNSVPSVPTGLSATVAGSDVTFGWAASTDAETPQEGLSYNLRVGTTSGGDEVFPGMADGAGFRRIPALGNAQENLSWTLSLPPDTYFWSVQAIDTAFAGSPWAPEKTVTVP